MSSCRTVPLLSWELQGTMINIFSIYLTYSELIKFLLNLCKMISGMDFINNLWLPFVSIEFGIWMSYKSMYRCNIIKNDSQANVTYELMNDWNLFKFDPKSFLNCFSISAVCSWELQCNTTDCLEILLGYLDQFVVHTSQI